MLVTRTSRSSPTREKDEELIMKYFAAMCLLAAPLAIAAAPTAADAAPRNGYSCHFVKKTVWSFHKKRSKWVRVCTQKPRFAHYNRHR
jgi:hypothetical protein